MKHKIVHISLMVIFAGIYTKMVAQDTSAVKVDKPTEKTVPIQHGKNFVDEDGDGYNDNAPDHDGDGIPNGLDPDYIKGKGKEAAKDLPYVDLNGDGINDNLQFGRKRKRFGQRKNAITPQSTTTEETPGQKGKRKGKGRG